MQKTAILYDASQIVLSTFDLDEVLQQILVIARDYFRLPTAAILLRDPKADNFYVRTQIGWDAKAEKLTFALGQGIQGAAAKLKRPLYVPDVTQDPRYLATAPGTRSQVAIPLMVRPRESGGRRLPRRPGPSLVPGRSPSQSRERTGAEFSEVL